MRHDEKGILTGWRKGQLDKSGMRTNMWTDMRKYTSRSRV